MGRKKTQGEFRQVGFRMPLETFGVLSRYADARGVDLTAVLNGLIADALPDMAVWLARKEEAMRLCGDGVCDRSREGKQD